MDYISVAHRSYIQFKLLNKEADTNIDYRSPLCRFQIDQHQL